MMHGHDQFHQWHWTIYHTIPLDDEDKTNDEGVDDVNDSDYDARTKPGRPGYRKWKAPAVKPSTVIEGKCPK